MKSLFSKTTDIKDLVLSPLNKAGGRSYDIKTRLTLKKRRKEVIAFMNRSFELSNFTVSERNKIYGLIFSLFSNSCKDINSIFWKLFDKENDLLARDHIARILAFQLTRRKGTNLSEEDFLVFKAKAEQGLPEAQFLTGMAYERGLGVARSIMVAQDWYEKAAAQGFIRAQHELKRLGL